MLRPLQKAFITAYAICGNITEAAALAKVGRRSHYDWLDEPEYADALKDAHESYCDSLRKEVRERALKGVAEPVVYQGQLQFEPLRDGHGQIKRDKKGNPMLSKTPLVIWKKSDNLLMFESKKHMPEYRESFKHEHTAEVNLKFQGSLADLLATYRDLTHDSSNA